MKKIVAALLAASFAIAGTGSFATENTAEDGGMYTPKAFPTAEGGGMYTSGARGALEDNKDIEVYHVKNLNDSGEGSFRDAVSKGNRIIVFDVSGMIDLQSQLTIGHDNLTILGQTAPGDGICFRSNNIKVGASNVILRYLRFRVGSKLSDGSDTRAQDGLEVTDNCQNVIIDHCSISWGTDENLSAYAVKDVTVQNCIIAEALNQSVHDKGEHSYGGIWGGVNVSFHHNIIATHKSRNPKIGTSETVAMTSGYTDKETVIDMWNNVIYNWGDKAGYGAENGANVNLVNNYYKAGPA
ncbi:MAG: pectate lyase, partial [Clostridia bacterium]|nr:pectate lyase [Clostridia bacterium]